MKAVIFREFGGVDRLEVAEVEKPSAGAGEVVVRVQACGLNRLDLWARSGRLAVKIPLPHILGAEVAGEIAEVGAGVTGLTSGQSVVIAPYLFCGQCQYCLAGEENLCLRGDILGMVSNGGYAEYVRVPARSVLPIPAGVTPTAAAAVALATLTAWHMLVNRAPIHPGQDVLVMAASGGVGVAAVQIAKLAGAHVIAAVSSAGKGARVRALGADEIVNSAEQDLVQEVRRLTGKRGVDVVVENVGAETWEQSATCLGRRGRLVTCGATTGSEGKMNLWTFFSKELQFIGSYGGTRADLLAVLNLVQQGRLQPVIDTILPLDHVADGHRRLEDRAIVGKVLLTP